jgi:DNA methyltransferase 1-associated protein 1
MTPFVNTARSDDLVLRHWKRVTPPVILPNKPEGEEGDDATQTKEKAMEETPFARFNIKAQCPKRYTDEEYDRLLQSDDWSREETDYLMSIAQEYDLRWVVIADRYDYRPAAASMTGESTALVPAGRHRTMEDMKARYYTVASRMLVIEHPPSEMSATEFETYERMRKFDPEREKTRKELAMAQLNRSKDEVAEERLLLEELKRIVTNERNFNEERKELYARLEAPITTANTAVYQSSQGLGQLLQTLLTADKNKKRRPLLGPDTGTSSPGSQGAQATPSGARESRPETPSAAGPSQNNRKGSSAAAAAAGQVTVKTLTPSEEGKYGVSHHDRLTSGVQFRNDRAQKLTQAKSNVQAQKLAAALTELDIPPRLFMPTEKVCKEFEKLVHAVNLLLDARKVSEKVESEIRVLEAAREERERKAREEADGIDPESQQEEKDAAQQEDPDGTAEETAAGEPPSSLAQAQGDSGGDAGEVKTDQPPGNNGLAPPPSTAEGLGGSPTKGAHKRSASVLSVVSDKSTKKQRK